MLLYSLEAPCRGASNEYPQHIFTCRNKENNAWTPLLSGAMVDPDAMWSNLYQFIALISEVDKNAIMSLSFLRSH